MCVLFRAVRLQFYLWNRFSAFLFLCSVATGNDTFLSSQNFSTIRDTPDGNFHLTEPINLGGKVIQPVLSYFNGSLDGHDFTIYNFTLRGRAAAAGIFGRLADNTVIKRLGFSDIRLQGNSTYPLAAKVENNCTIQINFVRNIVVNSHVNASALVGSVGNNNTISVGYIGDLYGVNTENAASLALTAGDNNFFSLGYGSLLLLAYNQSAGVVGEVGTNNTVANSLVVSRQIPGTSRRKSISFSNHIICENTLWSSDSGADDSGCDAPGFTKDQLKQLTHSSPDIAGLDTDQFRFGDVSQYPLNKETGAMLARLHDSICTKVACQPQLCDAFQGLPVTQIFDEAYQYRYIMSEEVGQGATFRLTRMLHDGTLDKSFGDGGIARYSPANAAPGNLHFHNVSMIFKNALWVVVTDGTEGIKILKLPLDGIHYVNEYTVETPAFYQLPIRRIYTTSETPVLILTYRGYLITPVGAFSGLSIVLVTYKAAESAYRVFISNENHTGRFLLFPRTFSSGSDPIRAITANPDSTKRFVYYVIDTGVERIVKKVDIFEENLDDDDFVSEADISSVRGIHLFTRDTGVWLIQENNAGEFSVELFDILHDPQNETIIYSFKGKGFPSDGLILPDNAEHPLIHLAAFNTSLGCLEVENIIYTEVTATGCQWRYYCALYDLFSQLIIFLKSFRLYLRIWDHEPSSNND